MNVDKLAEIKEKASKSGYQTEIIEGCIHLGKTLSIEDEDVIEYDDGKIRIWYPRTAAVSLGDFIKKIEEQQKMVELAKEILGIGAELKRLEELRLLEELKKKYPDA